MFNKGKIYLTLIAISSSILFFSCEKELSVENSGDSSDLIVGKNCRISKMVYVDTASNVSLGSLFANINVLDKAEQITAFDSLAQGITFQEDVTYSNDTVFLNPDEYFVIDLANNRVKKLHGLSDPTDVLSPQIDVDYTYNSNGFLINKLYKFTIGSVPVVNIDYIYAGNNLVKMTNTNLISGDVESDAVMQYHNNIAPQNYMYVFPDEFTHYPYIQFFNFGRKNANAIKQIKLYEYSGGVATDSLISNFDSYRLSRDNYVLDVIMSGDDQPGIPAPKSKIKFSYKCK